jgi:hypothetical protein
MPIKFSGELDSRHFENKLRVFASGLGNVFKELMSEVGKKMVAEAQTRAPNRTGRLARSINFIATENGGVFTTRKNLNRSNVWYSNIVEHGTNVRAKKKKYLVFKVNGEWKKVESVGAKPRPFMKPVFDDYFGENGKGYRLLAEALERKMESGL